jgi:hypothetical protein
MNFESRNPATGELLGVVEDVRFGPPPKPRRSSQNRPALYAPSQGPRGGLQFCLRPKLECLIRLTCRHRLISACHHIPMGFCGRRRVASAGNLRNLCDLWISCAPEWPKDRNPGKLLRIHSLNELKKLCALLSFGYPESPRTNYGYNPSVFMQIPRIYQKIRSHEGSRLRIGEQSGGKLNRGLFNALSLENFNVNVDQGNGGGRNAGNA